MSTNTQGVTPPGWYQDTSQPTGVMRYWDGNAWTGQYHDARPAQPIPAVQHTHGPMTSGQMNVNRQVYYNRQQKGHSIVLHLLLGWVLLWIPAIYYSVSPNHYWHA